MSLFNKPDASGGGLFGALTPAAGSGAKPGLFGTAAP